MWSISKIKSRGKDAFKANYVKSVIVAFILSLLTRSATTASGQKTNSEEVKAQLLDLDPAIISFLIGFLITLCVVSLLLRIFLFNPLEVGGYAFFKRNVEEGDAHIDALLEGFKDYGHIFITLLLRDIFLALWTCLLVIPGIIKSYSYRMVPYIISDNPELSATEVITKSREMMNGNKWHAFLLDLSFIGWIILSVCTCGLVGIFWLNPYMENTNAALYLELSKNTIE